MDRQNEARDRRASGRTSSGAPADAEPFAPDGGPIGVVRQPRLHRHAREHAALGRSPGRGGLHRPAAAAARARRHLAGDQPDPLAAVVRRRSSAPTPSSPRGATPSSPSACRWAARWSPGWPSSTGDAIAGLVLVNPAYAHPALRRQASPRTSRGGQVAARPSAATSRSPASRSRRTTAPRWSRSRRCCKLWKMTVADLARVTRADPHVPHRARTTSSTAVGEAAQGRRHLDRRSAEIMLENSYHVATLDNDAEQIFEGSVEFIESPATADTHAMTRPTTTAPRAGGWTTGCSRRPTSRSPTCRRRSAAPARRAAAGPDRRLPRRDARRRRRAAPLRRLRRTLRRPHHRRRRAPVRRRAGRLARHRRPPGCHPARTAPTAPARSTSPPVTPTRSPASTPTPSSPR